MHARLCMLLLVLDYLYNRGLWHVCTPPLHVALAFLYCSYIIHSLASAAFGCH